MFTKKINKFENWSVLLWIVQALFLCSGIHIRAEIVARFGIWKQVRESESLNLCSNLHK